MRVEGRDMGEIKNISPVFNPPYFRGLKRGEGER